MQGFVDSTRILNATVGSAFDIPMVLAVAGLETSVTVIGESTTLEAARSQIAGTLPQAEIQTTPLNGRNFLDLALLVPGVSPTNIGSTQLFAETSAVPGQGISIASQRNLSNNFVVDGLSANDDAAGLSAMTYSVYAIEQFQVVTSGGQAELGRALGGFINVVTRSGTNALRGTLYNFVRDDNFNAPNALSGTTLPMDQQQYGASLGGPIARNRTFFFSNFEQRLLDQTGLVTILPASVAVINTRLAATDYPGSSITTGVYPNPVHSANVLGKVDHHVSGSDHLTVRYSLYHVTADNARGAGALNAPTASSALDNVDQSVGFGNTWTMSPRTVNETRAQFVYSDLKAPPTDTIGPAVNIAGVAAFGTFSGSPTRRTNKMYQFVNTLSHQAGVHALRGGVDVVLNDDAITYPRSARGNYSFSSLATESSTGRGTTGSMKHEEHQHLQTNRNPTDGIARAQLSRLFFATLGKADSPRSITSGVCYCCKTAIATDASGGVYAVWRHVYPGNVRDIAFSKSADGGRTFTSPVRISDDNWVLDGCPENGPAMVVDRSQRIHIVWPTLVPGATPAREPTLALFYAMSQDGRRFTPRQQIPTRGIPRHPQIVLGSSDEPIVAWDEQASGTRRVAVARGRVGSEGTASFVRQPVSDSLRAEYPVLAIGNDAVIVAWTSGPTGQTVLRAQKLMN